METTCNNIIQIEKFIKNWPKNSRVKYDNLFELTRTFELEHSGTSVCRSNRKQPKKN